MKMKELRASTHRPINKPITGEVLKSLTTNDSDHEKREQHENVVEQYKNIIREQV